VVTFGDYEKTQKKKKNVFHTMALPFTLKKYFTAKEEFMRTQIFQHAKNIIFKKSSNRNPKSFKIS